MSQDNNALLMALLGRTSATNAWSAASLLLGGSISRSKWGPRFETWASPLSDTADQKCQTAESVISSAITADTALSGITLRTFAQGSYKANTNVRDDSDVDICVCNKDTFFYELPPGATLETAGISHAGISFPDFKNMVGAALYNRFSYLHVTRGNKAFNVKANTYRIHADVVPAFEYRKYYWQGFSLPYVTGICFFTDTGEKVVNWPEQTLANGRAKNENTSRRYKKVVRVLKGLRYEMEEKGYASAKKVSSFQLACLAYNLEDYWYGNDELYDDVKGVANQIWYHTYETSRCAGWTEIDNIKPLFSSDQKRVDATNFIWDLIQYAELSGND